MGNRDLKQEFLNKSDQCLKGSGILMSLPHCVTLAGIRISSASELYPFAISEEYKITVVALHNIVFTISILSISNLSEGSSTARCSRFGII